MAKDPGRPIPPSRRDRRATRNKAEQLQGILDADNNKSELLQAALTTAETKPTSIEHLPAELTDKIWSYTFGPPVSKKAISYKPGELDANLVNPKLWSAEEEHPSTHTRHFAIGNISAFYSLNPPLLAHLCHSSREYALEKYGLNHANKTVQKRRSNNKRRWTYECLLPVVSNFVSHWDIFHRATLHGPLTLTTNDWHTWANEEDLSLSLPLNILLGPHGRVILHLHPLRYGLANPFQTFNVALLDLLLSARDHEIAIALRRDVLWHSSTDRCLDRNPSLAGWAHRGARYISIDDTAAFRELVAISDYVSSQKTIFKGKDTDVVSMISMGTESRAEVSKRVLEPCQELWERVNRERNGTGHVDGIIPATAEPPQLKSLPKMDVVVPIKFDYSVGETWYLGQRELQSMSIQHIGTER